MYQQTLSTSESPRVEVTGCHGDLTVAAWDKPEVLVEVDREELLTVEEREDTLVVAINGEGNLTVPRGARLVILQVHGDLSVQEVQGGVEATTVHGDAWLKGGAEDAALNTVQGDLAVEDWDGAVSVGTAQGNASLQQVAGAVSLGTVGGDLAAADIGGALSATSIGGDADLRAVDGGLSLDNVGGDLTGWDILAGMDAAHVGGDVALKTVLAGPHTYRLQAGGDVTLKALPDSSATFIVQSVGGQVKAKGIAGETAEKGQWRGVMGEGEAQVILSAGGDVKLRAVGQDDEEEDRTPFEPFWSEMGAMAGEFGWRIQQHVAEKLSKIDFESIARREAERARRQMEREMARAQRHWEKAQHKAERAPRKHGGPWSPEWGAGRGESRPAGRGQAVSEEERLAVLHMLAEGKISAAEAETLLRALEG